MRIRPAAYRMRSTEMGWRLLERYRFHTLCARRLAARGAVDLAREQVERAIQCALAFEFERVAGIT